MVGILLFILQAPCMTLVHYYLDHKSTKNKGPVGYVEGVGETMLPSFGVQTYQKPQGIR